MRSRILIIGVLTGSVLTPLAFRVGGVPAQEGRAAGKQPTNDASYDWQLPDPRWQ
jgi:hypothetical protein